MVDVASRRGGEPFRDAQKGVVTRQGGSGKHMLENMGSCQATAREPRLVLPCATLLLHGQGHAAAPAAETAGAQADEAAAAREGAGAGGESIRRTGSLFRVVYAETPAP